MSAESRYLNLSEAATASRLSERTIRRALHDRKSPLRHYRIGRRVVIAETELRAWIEAHVSTTAPSPSKAAERVLTRLSPTARELLAGILCTPAAPQTAKRAISHG
jgi:excisionase family DNA binding protein